MKKIIVTGAAGFIGCNFVRLALSKGYEVIGLDALTYAGHRENLANLGPSFSLVVGDIGDAKLVSELLAKHQPDAILNFAAESHVDRSITNPLLFVQTNVLGTANLLNHSLNYWKSLSGTKKQQFRYLQVSTDEVYGSLGESGKFSEATPLAPSSAYSASKAGADLLVNAWFHTYGLPTTITRCSNNYGPYQFPEKLIPHMIACALAGEKLPVYGKGINIRDWIHVGDHCAGILAAFEKGKAGEVYCLGGNAERKNIDVVNLICTSLDKLKPKSDGSSYTKQISFVTDRLGHDLRYAIDDTYAKEKIQFQRKHQFEDGLQATIEWYLANQPWCESVLKTAKGKV